MRNATLSCMLPEDRSLHQAQSHHPREFPDFTYAYPVLSRRSGGVSIGVNLNIDKNCNFDCPYCQVDRSIAKPKTRIDLDILLDEVGRLLAAMDSGGICRLPQFAGIPDEAKRLRDIAVSGDGEPTMVPEFPEVCAGLSALQATRPDLDFKLVLITNSTMLDKDPVLKGISSLLSRKGEVWAKLDAGTEAWFQRINVSRISLDRIEANLIRLGQSHPFAIQSMFHGFEGGDLPAGEVDAYLDRLRRIRQAGSRILGVQLYTLARKPSQASCTPVSSGFLREVKNRIETEAGLRARVYGVPE